MVTTYFKDLIADHVWNTGAAKALPTTYYLALSKTEPKEDGTGVTEPESLSGYARIAASGLSDAANGVVSNSQMLSWPKILTNQGEAPFWGLYDAASGGHLLMGNPFEEAKHLDSGTTISVDIKGLELQFLGV